LTKLQKTNRLIVILIASALVSSQPSVEAGEKFWLGDGLRLLHAKKFEEALIPLTKAIKQSSNDWSSDYRNCVIFLSKVKTPDNFFEIKDHNMYVVNACTARGVAHGSLGKDKEAIEDFNLAIKAFTPSPKARCNRGQVYLRQKLPQLALKDFDAAIQQTNHLAEAYVGRAKAYQMLGQPQKAEADIRRASMVRNDPENEFVEAHFHRDRLVDDALKQNPKNAVLLTEKGMECIASNKLDKGIEYFKQAVTYDPTLFEAYGGLADCYLNQENYDAALAMVKKQEQMKPGNVKALMRMGLIYINTRRLKEGAPYLKRLLQLPAKTAEEFRFRGLCYIGLEKPREAMIELEKSLKLNDRNPHTWDDLAMCLHEMKRYSEAIQAENKAISIKPDFATGYMHRAQNYAKLHSLEAADADLDRALALAPKDKSIYRLKSAVEAMRGNMELSFADGQTGSSSQRIMRSVTKEELIKESARYSKIIATIPSQPAPYYDRALLRIALENLPAGIDDLRTFLKLSKWNGRSASYAASLLVLALRENGQPKEADETLKIASSRMNSTNTVPIIEFLLGKKDQQAMLKSAGAGNTETRDRLLLGIYLLQNNKIAEAKKQLEWLQKKGDQNIDEYVLVSLYSRKLGIIPRKEPHRFDSQ